MIDALFVETGGVYYGLPGIDPWDESRDARLYSGPWPVIAHPPCARWGRYWSGGPSAKIKRKLGDDDGCFESALSSVNRWGGVLEHPEGSHAWRMFALAIPPRGGGWIRSGKGWTCCVEQGHYGHRARKMTWLYANFENRPSDLIWGESEAKIKLDDGFHSTAERRRASRTWACQRMSKKERMATPILFRDALMEIVQSCWHTKE